jgi:hypothetical protein
MELLKKNSVVFVLSLLVYLPLSHLVDRTWSIIEWKQLRHPLWFQSWAYRVMTYSGRPQMTIADLPSPPDYPNLSNQCQKYIKYYDPNAWDDPQRMFFLYQKGPFLWATFGDGMQAIMTYWHQPNPILKAGESKPRALSISGEVPYLENYPRVVALGAIAILITIFLNGRFSWEKRANAPATHEKESERMMPLKP